MKFWEINSAIKDEMRLDPGLVTDDERVRFINACLDEIGGLNLIELETIRYLSQDQYPTLPTGLTKILRVYWNDQLLRSMHGSNDPDDTGTPIGYVLEAGTMRLYPAPASTGTLKLHYTGIPAYCTSSDLDENAVTFPDLPVTWHKTIVDYACYRSHRKNGNTLMAREYKLDYTRGLSDNIRSYVSFLNSQVVDGSAPEQSTDDVGIFSRVGSLV